jgi:hypothetical protein
MRKARECSFFLAELVLPRDFFKKLPLVVLAAIGMRIEPHTLA